MRAAVFVTCNLLTMNLAGDSCWHQYRRWFTSLALFPENLMGKDLVDYLSGAIQGVKRITRRWFMVAIRNSSPINQ